MGTIAFAQEIDDRVDASLRLAPAPSGGSPPSSFEQTMAGNISASQPPTISQTILPTLSAAPTQGLPPATEVSTFELGPLNALVTANRAGVASSESGVIPAQSPVGVYLMTDQMQESSTGGNDNFLNQNLGTSVGAGVSFSLPNF